MTEFTAERQRRQRMRGSTQEEHRREAAKVEIGSMAGRKEAGRGCEWRMRGGGSRTVRGKDNWMVKARLRY